MKVKKVAVLVDYENIAIQASGDIKVPDLGKLEDECLKYGIIIHPMVFVSESGRYLIHENVYDKGFFLMLCPEVRNGQIKEKDRVDTLMTEYGIRLIEHSDIDIVVVVTNDGDFVRLLGYAKQHHKKVVVFGGDNTSHILKNAFEVQQCPTKDR